MEGRQGGLPDGVNNQLQTFLNALLQQQGIPEGSSVHSQSLAAFGNGTSNNAQGRDSAALASLVQQRASVPTNAHNHQGSYNPMIHPLALTPFALSQLLSNQNALQHQTGGVAPVAQNQSFFNYSHHPQAFGQAALPGPNTTSLSSQPTAASKTEPSIPSTGRTLSLFLSVDEDNLSTYQCLVRKQIELFEATQGELEANAQGRNKPILEGQVGIRCRHCGVLPLEKRKKGAVYFPSQLVGLYQTAQNMANSHLLKNCSNIPRDIREDLIRLREVRKAHKSGAGGGREYWANGLRVQGVVEFDRRLRFSMTQHVGEGEVSVHVA
jgi:hypothetical protein